MSNREIVKFFYEGDFQKYPVYTISLWNKMTTQNWMAIIYLP